ncbi:hypothetical protein D556_0248 [Bordetella holmesii 41130]|uniref:N-acetyltransferase YedL n=1 Tax=Bordetella holmesii 1058 TaxID=1247648 RepID=A0ABP3BKB1_9BORD|nr:hypothetical protein D560_0249 [Bordetella holmesii ATCC 51541]EWM48599.1 hypothetical protein D556_0248 [Bordetella holmesii 41130]EXX94798.1 hypothetical protein D559_2221 [Bordetella holmesii 1058]
MAFAGHCVRGQGVLTRHGAEARDARRRAEQEGGYGSGR